tara:strand:- start:306 stop:479 length:174 start_codon:yes stop_codon:yes gene_type:complete
MVRGEDVLRPETFFMVDSVHYWFLINLNVVIFNKLNSKIFGEYSTLYLDQQLIIGKK